METCTSMVDRRMLDKIVVPPTSIHLQVDSGAPFRQESRYQHWIRTRWSFISNACSCLVDMWQIGHATANLSTHSISVQRNGRYFTVHRRQKLHQRYARALDSHPSRVQFGCLVERTESRPSTISGSSIWKVNSGRSWKAKII